MKFVILPVELVNAIGDYLDARPHGETFEMVASLKDWCRAAAAAHEQAVAPNA